MSERMITLFGNKTLGPYKLSDIFDPDVDGADPAAAGKIVPALYAQIVDDTQGKRNKLYTVVAVHATTFKVTMIPSAFIATTDDEERIVSYGNDIYMLYYIAASGRLIVDNKLTFFGDSGVKYQLLRLNQDGTTTVISKYESDPAGGAPVVSTIDLVTSEVTYAKKCPNCYTDLPITPGQQITLRIIDNTNVVMASVVLIATEASGVVEALGNPVVDLKVTANQMDGDDLVLFHNQNKSDLKYTVKTVHADQSEDTVTIDGVVTHLYGAGEINTSIPDSNYQLLFKRYLPSSDYAVNYVACVKNVRIIAAPPYGYAKLSPIPIWNTTTKKWDLKLLAYYADRITNAGYVTPTITHNGGLFDVAQTVVINTTHQNPLGVDESYTQSFSIKYNSPLKIVFDSIEYTLVSGAGVTRIWKNSLNPSEIKTISYSGGKWVQFLNSTSVHNSNITTDTSNPWDGSIVWYQTSTGTATAKKCVADAYIQQHHDATNWLIGTVPNTGNIYYGNNTSVFKRPKIYYGTRSENPVTPVYHIPRSIFGTSSTSTSNVINNFYVNASPPKRSYEAFAPTPTHFTVKNSGTLETLLPSPKPIDNWNDALALGAGYSGKTVIVESLLEDSGSYMVLYGVPVEVVSLSV